LTLRPRIVLLLLAFGLMPALLLTGTYLVQRQALKQAAMARLADAAAALTDSIDRNLFERYGDVQAFGLNTAAHDPRNWKRPGKDNPLVETIDQYMAAYGVYKMAVLVDPEGRVLAVNSRDAAGKPVQTEALYQRSFAGAPWLGKALRGEFLAGPAGLTGTVVEPPARAEVVAEAYPGEDGYSIVFAAPVKDQAGKLIGVWANYTDFGLVEQIVADFHGRLVASGMPAAEVTMLDARGVVIVDYDPAVRPGPYRRDFAVIGQLNLAERGVAAAVAARDGGSGAIVATHARKQIDQASGYARSEGAMGFAGLGWSALVRVPTGEAFATLHQIEQLGMIGLVLALLIITGLGLWIGTGFARPITRIAQAMRTLAAGQPLPEVPGAARRDEIGDMARSVVVFRDALAEADAARTRQEAERREAEQAKRASLQAMAQRVEAEAGAAVAAISSQAGQMAEEADGMAQTAETVAESSASVTDAAAQALANVQTVAAATEQLSASVREISQQVAAATTTTRRAAARGEASEAVIRGLSESAAKVGAVVRLISDIAGQTNLLALNATIEAARAGDAGKGFAVVAGEVKQLAAQTAKATDEIARQVAEITNATEGAVATVREIAADVAAIDETSSAIAAAVEEQSAATQEIARTVAETADAARLVSERIHEVSVATVETGRRAAAVREGASEARGSIAELQGVLVRIVRTATPEVDRRADPRVTLPRQVTLEAGGRSSEARLVDLSLGGAQVTDAPALSAGARGTLRIPDLGLPLAFDVVTAEGGTLHLRFAADEAARTRLAGLLEGMAAAA